MEYLFLVIVLILWSAKGVFGKKVGTEMHDTGDAFLFNLARMIFCLIIGFIIVLIGGEISYVAIDGGMLLICIFSGLVNALMLVSWILAVRKTAMVTLDVTTTIGSILPAILCFIFFNEAIYWQKALGFVLVVIAAIILAGYKTKNSSNRGFIDILFVILTMVSDGLISFAQQLCKQFYAEGGMYATTTYPKSVFHFYTYVFAVLGLLLVFVGYKIWQYKHEKQIQPINKPEFIKNSVSSLIKPLPLIAIMAVCMFGANYLQTVITNDYHMSSQLLYPMVRGGCLVIVNFTGMIFFGEKITLRSAIGTAIAIGGIVVMNL